MFFVFLYILQAIKYGGELRDEERAGLATVIVVGKCLNFTSAMSTFDNVFQVHVCCCNYCEGGWWSTVGCQAEYKSKNNEQTGILIVGTSKGNKK